MNRRLFLAASIAASASVPFDAFAAGPPRTAADWSRVVVATPEGGFRMGNPKAKVALIEYGSLTCPHCRHFAETGFPALSANYVRSGKVSYEFRNMVLNGIDVAATLVARCGGPRPFFPTVGRLYATQPLWTGRVTNLSAAQRKALSDLPENQRLMRIAEVSGIVAIAAKQGISTVAAKRCLADPTAFDRLGKMYEQASALGVDGTPSFFVNGKSVGTIEWPQLEPLLKNAGG